ncbi:hypothetical protein MUK42_37452 [Musa troglodytarum]|uniref:Uncharacterized protein n=1 Tax=Musa troglodytarum TaxID=320322 RepID=A0A9E7KL96_9LILI|nr:hypothetical protein MUK42_37452 [Musa troglodytarum]
MLKQQSFFGTRTDENVQFMKCGYCSALSTNSTFHLPRRLPFADCGLVLLIRLVRQGIITSNSVDSTHFCNVFFSFPSREPPCRPLVPMDPSPTLWQTCSFTHLTHLCELSRSPWPVMGRLRVGSTSVT